MPGKFSHGNNKQRFDLFTFYALLTKCKIVNLLDHEGNTPFDSDAMRNNVWDYAAALQKDILEIGQMVSYHDSDEIGPGSTPEKTESTFTDYNNLKKTLYALGNDNGLDNTKNTITTGFKRKYYTVPVSDSEGTIRHTSINLFLKLHFDRWIRFDPFERYKLASRVMDNLDADSDLRNRFAHNFIRAIEEDSDLSRRVVEVYSNVMQTDSEVRNEILHTAITALSGLTPGGDSDAARALTEIVSGVFETDSDARNEYGDLILESLQNDSDQQRELGDILSSTEIPLIQAIDLIARRILPMDGDGSGKIGDSEQRWSFADFTKILVDNLKPTTIDSKQVVFTSNDSERRLIGSDNLRFHDDSDNPLEYMGRRLIAIDSDTFFRLLIENESAYTLDSDGVISTLLDTPVKSEYAWFIGQRGDVYVIGEDPPDSEFFTPITDSDLTDFFGPEGNITGGEGTVGYFGLTSDGFGNTGLTGVYAPSLNLTASTAPGGNSSNVFKEGNTIYPGGITGKFEISYKIAGFGFTGFSMFPTSTSAEASRTYLGTVSGTHVQVKSMTGYFYAQARLDNIQNSSSSAGSPYGGYRNQHFSGNITLSSYHGGAVGGSGGSIVVPGLTGGTFDSAYATIVHQGRDSEGYWYIAVTGYDSTLSAMRRSPNYYFDGGSATNATLKTHDELVAAGRTAPHYARYGHNITDGLQLGYGNYDFYPVTQFRDITITGFQKSNIIVNKNNKLQTKKLIFTSDKVVDTPSELARARNDVVTKQQVFNTWYRFNHGRGSGGGSPGVFTYPYDQNQMTYGWAYSPVTDTIFTTINSSNFSGFVSTDAYQDFGFDSIVRAHYTGHGFINYDPVIQGTGSAITSYQFSDDDAVINIVAFVTEGIFGQPGYREHTLSVIRTAGGFPVTNDVAGARTAWCLFYNYQQDDGRLLIDGRNFGTASTGIQYPGIPWQNFPNGSKVSIRRKGDIIRAYCSQMNDATHTIDSDTELYWDLASDSDTLKFRGPVRYGYGAHSQLGSNWSSIVFAPTEGQYLHNFVTNSEFNSSTGGNVYQYDIDYATWNMDSDLTVDNTAGERMLHNEDTHKTFYNDPISNTAIQVMSARKFSDVIHLPMIFNAPDSDLLGPGGLVAGTIARASGYDNTLGETIVTYDSELNSYFATAPGPLTWTAQDATYGNQITMFSSPGTNDFKEANTTKPGGFTGATEIRFNISGFGYNGFLMLPTSANLEASNSYADSMPGSPAYIWTKTESGSGGFYCYFANGANATTGAVYAVPYWEGTAGSTLTFPGVTANYYGGTYPVRFIIGRDRDGAIYVQTIGDGSTNTSSVSLKYYIDASGNPTSTKSATVKKMNPAIGVQYAYGNYDGGAVEVMTQIIVHEYPANQYWDPKSLGAGNGDYYVFFNGTAWQRMDTS